MLRTRPSPLRRGLPLPALSGAWLALALLVLAPFVALRAAPDGESFAELAKRYAESEGQSALDRLPILQALGKCPDPRAGKLLADTLAAGGDKTVLLEVVVRSLGVRGDEAALSAVIPRAFEVLPEVQWRAVEESFETTMDATAVSWLTEKGYQVAPKVPPRAQIVILRLLASANDERAGLAAARLLGNRKIGPRLQADLVDLLRVHHVDSAKKKIAKMFRYDDSDLQVAVLRALRTMDAEEHSKIFHEAIESRHWPVRAIAADIFGGTHDAELIPSLEPLLDDAFPEVQVAAIHAIRKIGGRDAVPPLVAALETAEGRTKDDLADALLWLTGEDLGPDAIAWKTWWKLHGDTAEVKGITREEFDRLREESSDRSTGTYYGLRVISRYVTFVIDVSGSMQEPYFAEASRSGEEGKKKKGSGTSVEPGESEKKKRGKIRREERQKIEVAREELKRALHGLRNGTQFNLIQFDSQFHRWQPALVEMSDEVREEAIAHIDSLKPGGMTNVYDTLEAALSDPKVNTVYFLSDGAPTNGRVTDPDEILGRIAELNEVRKVKIHTIGFHLDPVARELMRKLAEQNYGSFVPR